MRKRNGQYSRRVFSIILVLMLIFTAIVILISYWQNTRMFRENMQQKNESAARNLQNSLDTIFRECVIANSYGFISLSAQQFMACDTFDELLNTSICDELFKITAQCRYMKTYVYEIGFYAGQADAIYLTAQDGGSLNSGAMTGEWAELCSYMEQLNPLQIAYYPHWNQNRSSYLLTIIKKNREGTGASFLSIDMKKLSFFVSDEISARYYMIGEDDTILYSGEKSELGLPSAQVEHLKLLTFDDTITEDHGESLISAVRSERYPWYYVSDMDIESVHLTKNQQSFIGVLVAICLIVGVLYAFMIAHTASRPLEEVVDMMSSQKLANHSYTVKEVRVISEKLTSILLKNDALQSALDERMKDFNALQSTALQYQINPHFLFNTINMISICVAKELGARHELVTMLSRLSAVLRYSLDVKSNVVPLEKELEYTKQYLDILQRRHDMFTIQIDIRPEWMQYGVLRMSLQPLIENAVYHGIQPKQNGKLNIGAAVEDSELCIWVQDNGIGMTPEQLQRLYQQINEDKLHSEHLGLSNVHRRLKLLFGERYGLEITSEVEKGTKVQMRLPIVRAAMKTES